MGVLIVTPTWFPPSELWMARQVDLLGEHVVGIAHPDPPESTYWGRIPAIPLRNGPVPLWRRAAPRLGLAVSPTPLRTAADALADAVANPAVTTVLVHYLNFAAGFERVWAETDKPVFVHCHGYDFNLDCRRHDTPDQLLFKPAFRARAQRVCERCTIIANSHHSARRLTETFSPPRLVVKPLGVPVPDACPAHSDRTRDVQILYVGRLADCKGPDLVIRAFERACELGLDAHLTLAGDGELRTMCELLRRRSPVASRIHMPGPVTPATASELRAAADVFTLHNCPGPLTHEVEAYGVSIVEALADGLPVITGRSGGPCETIVDGQTGILVHPGDLEAHALALLRLARDPQLRARMGHTGWQHVATHYSLDRERDALLDLLDLTTPASACQAMGGA